MVYLVGLPSHHNLREHLQRFLDRKRTCLPEVEDIPLKAASTSGPDSGGSLNDQIGAVTSNVSAGSSQAERTDQPQEQVEPELPHALVGQEIELASLTYAERKKKISRDKRYARYEHILALHQAGVSGRAIARELHMSRRIVQRYLCSDGFPERAPGSGRRAFGKSKLDLYLIHPTFRSRSRRKWEYLLGWGKDREGANKGMQTPESYVNERLDHLGLVAGVCEEIGLAAYLDRLAGENHPHATMREA